MFASRTVAEHLARGVAGLGLLGAAVYSAPAHAWAPFVALPLALLLLRGCPTCWTIGLLETIAARATGRGTSGNCADGSCGNRS
jgi:hypothetical protein